MAASFSAGVNIVGGAYLEVCTHPAWFEVYGSGGRAISALAALASDDLDLTLHCYSEPRTADPLKARARLEGWKLCSKRVPKTGSFHYVHPMAQPEVENSDASYPALKVAGGMALRFGMLEGEARVTAEHAVYDPQNAGRARLFGANGSKATRLAVVLNEREARQMTSSDGSERPEVLAERVLLSNGAQAVVLKRGPHGAVVLDDSGFSDVPAYQTEHVWKIGSGDVFSAHFFYRWAVLRQSASSSALQASKATALYCDGRGFPSPAMLERFDLRPVRAKRAFAEGLARPRVYLAGPFFSLSQLWLVEQARSALQRLGLSVFSPYHDVGRGGASDVVERDLEALAACDVMFALCDTQDPGTIFEIGYARARDMPVVIYAENEPAKEVSALRSAHCQICKDFTSGIYRTSWIAMTS